MSVIFILIACSLVLASSFLGAYLWAAKSGQFDDDYTPSVRILYDDEGGLTPDKKSRVAVSDSVTKKSNKA